MAKGYAPDEGGMQSYASGVAQAYAAAGAKVTVFTQTSLGPRSGAVGPVLLVDVGPGRGAGVLFRLLGAVRRARSRGEAPVFVHGTTWRTSVVPMLLGLPYVTTFHGREFMGGGAATSAVLRRVARKALLAVAVSSYTAGRLRERLGGGVAPVVAHNGISVRPEVVEERDGREGNAVPFLFSLCRLEPRKNIAACLRACAALKARGRDFRYVIAGRGPEQAHLQPLVEELGLSRQVQLVGFVPDAEAERLYLAADIFLHPQIEIAQGRDFEGFGIAIADAMICGCSVIAGKDGGSAELVEDGVSGLVVDGEDDDALIAAIDRLLQDEGLRQRMAAAAVRRARENFSWGRHIAIIVQALDRQGRRSQGRGEGEQVGSPGRTAPSAIPVAPLYDGRQRRR